MKTCSKCKVEKPAEDFYRRSGMPHLLASQCRDCSRAQCRSYHARHHEELKQKDAAYRSANRQKRRDSTARFLVVNPDYPRKNALKRNYGLTIHQFDALLRAQGGGCAVCGATESGGRIKNLSVDHCHASKKVRGLLCNNCNRGIGLLGDSPVLLSKASAYVVAHNAIQHN